MDRNRMIRSAVPNASTCSHRVPNYGRTKALVVGAGAIELRDGRSADPFADYTGRWCQAGERSLARQVRGPYPVASWKLDGICDNSYAQLND